MTLAEAKGRLKDAEKHLLQICLSPKEFINPKVRELAEGNVVQAFAQVELHKEKVR